jgi:hypothetical protein
LSLWASIFTIAIEQTRHRSTSMTTRTEDQQTVRKIVGTVLVLAAFAVAMAVAISVAV